MSISKNFGRYRRIYLVGFQHLFTDVPLQLGVTRTTFPEPACIATMTVRPTRGITALVPAAGRFCSPGWFGVGHWVTGSTSIKRCGMYCSLWCHGVTRYYHSLSIFWVVRRRSTIAITDPCMLPHHDHRMQRPHAMTITVSLSNFAEACISSLTILQVEDSLQASM